MDGRNVSSNPPGHERHDMVELCLVAGAADHTTYAAAMLLAVAAATAHIVVRTWPRRHGPGPATLTRTSRDPAILRDRPSSQRVSQMLTEARAQYDVWPSDYLEGVVAALHEVVHRAPFAGRCRDGSQPARPSSRTMDARVYEYHSGRIAALAWIARVGGNPPIHVILTEPTTPPPGSQHTDPTNGG